MGKRKRKHSKYSDDHLLRKIRKLENELQKRRCSPSDISSAGEAPRASEPPSPAYSDGEIYAHSDYSDYEPSVRSVVEAQVHTRSPQPALSPSAARAPPRQTTSRPDGREAATESTSAEKPAPPLIPSEEPTPPLIIAQDILDALGESKTKEIPLGAKVPDEISKRWGRILIEGLSKELVAKMLIPENFQLLKAPILNQEISAVLNESSKKRDKRLEKNQHQLGLGIAGITSVMSSLIEGKNIESVDLVKTLSEIGQILLDLHYDTTINRQRLIMPMLDKKFLSVINDIKRDSHLFGENLGCTIKASKAAEKSGWQIKKPVYTTSSSKNYPSQTGSWKGPPRQPAQRAARPSAGKSRGAAPVPRRAQHPAERPHHAPPARPPPPARFTRR